MVVNYKHCGAFTEKSLWGAQLWNGIEVDGMARGLKSLLNKINNF